MTLPEEATIYATDRATTPAELTALSRAFMNGALQVLDALKDGATPEQLRAECRQYGRVIGTAVERAQA